MCGVGTGDMEVVWAPGGGHAGVVRAPGGWVGGKEVVWVPGGGGGGEALGIMCKAALLSPLAHQLRGQCSGGRMGRA
jgi:hypothetical protein